MTVCHIDSVLRIPCGRDVLEASLFLPDVRRGVVLFVHGSGSSRFSPRNATVADKLAEAGFAAVLADLLTTSEATDDSVTCRYRFDIDLLSRRAVAVVDSLATHAVLAQLPLGCFGSSTGAAAALRCAVERPDRVRAVVCRGGRPDLVSDAVIRRVKAPTLLVVGALDPEGIEANREAQALLRCPKRMVILPGAGHLFEGDGLERVARLTCEWFEDHLEG